MSVPAFGVNPHVKAEADSLAARGITDGLQLLRAVEAVRVADELMNGDPANARRIGHTFSYVDNLLSHIEETNRFLRRQADVTTHIQEVEQ
jgi:hypothetical protein